MNERDDNERDKDAGELKMPDVSPEEALAAFMQVDPEKVRKAEDEKRADVPDRRGGHRLDRRVR